LWCREPIGAWLIPDRLISTGLSAQHDQRARAPLAYVVLGRPGKPCRLNKVYGRITSGQAAEMGNALLAITRVACSREASIVKSRVKNSIASREHAGWARPARAAAKRTCHPGLEEFPLTKADHIRLNLIAGLTSSPQRAADRFVPADEATRIEPTVTQPFDAIEEHVGSVYRYALRLTRRPDLAEDLTQETLLRAWRNRQHLRDQRVTRVWLFKIATNLWTDQLRRVRFRPVTLHSEPACPRPLPASASDERENVRIALAAMDELPSRQRQVLYLVTCENMAHGEVATILGINESAVKANLSLARKDMRLRLKDIYEAVCGRQTTKQP
jgi:RNA polymerase sigma-70 factor (ECF subfamily)